MIGQQLNQFVLEQYLGGGGQGEVYLALDQKLRRHVAIKVLKQVDATNLAELQERFLQEAISIAQFDHVNVVKIYEYGIAQDGMPFLVMQFLDGQTVNNLPLPLSRELLITLVRNVCAALKKAHAAKLVHRDLKPSNLMLVERGQIEERFMILDLGLAKIMTQGHKHYTYAGGGTPLYMSPEQVMDDKQVDYRSDIYSFGSVLFELLTGCSPFGRFNGSLGQLLDAVRKSPPPLLKDICPGVDFSPELQGLVSDCLQKDPAKRPHSMQLVVERFASAMKISFSSGTSFAPVRLPVASDEAASSQPVPMPGESGAVATSMLVAPVALDSMINPAAVTSPVAAGTTSTVKPAPSTDKPTPSTKRERPTKTRAPAPAVRPTRRPIWLAALLGTVGLAITAALVLPALNGTRHEARKTVASVPSGPLVVDEIPVAEVAEETRFVKDLMEVIPAAEKGKVHFELGPEPPPGVTVSRKGRIEWRPSEAQGPGDFTIPISVIDEKQPARNTTVAVQVHVVEVNRPPVVAKKIEDLPASVGEKVVLDLNHLTADSDLPPNRLTFQLQQGAPEGAQTDVQSGVFTWTPTAEFAGQVVPVTIAVSDGGGRGSIVKVPFNVAVAAVSRNSDKKISNSIGMEFVRIDPGSFQMGSPSSEANSRDWERPQHEVTFDKPIYLGAYEVTQSQYEKIMKVNPSHFQGKAVDESTEQFPVESVTHEDAQRFCDALSELKSEKAAGRRYRLPTEAEWEYSCRAASTSAFSNGDEFAQEYAWSGQTQPAPVGSRLPNAWGLYDMQGNVWEWCSDFVDFTYYKKSPKLNPQGPAEASSEGAAPLDLTDNRIARGGDYKISDPGVFRSAFRFCELATERRENIGFRVVCYYESE